MEEYEWQQKLYKKHYSNLTAEQLLVAVTDEYITARPSKRGAWLYDFQKGDPLIINGTKISGLIWRDQETHRERPEPKEERQAIAEELYLTEGKLSQPFRDSILKGLTRYVQYRPLIVKRINELALPVLYGEREDIQALVSEYQAGNKEVLPRIKNQVGGIVYKVQKQFSYIGDKAVFTNLAGKINKKLKKPIVIYSDKSPMGGGEDPRLMLTMEKFEFAEEDINAQVDKSLIAALDSYRFTGGAKFKSWFYRILENDLIDLYREYQRGWQQGHIIKTYEEFEEELEQKVNPKLDYTEAAELLPPAIKEELTDQQYRWIALFLKMLPDRLSVGLTAEVLGISESTEYQIRQSLQEIIRNYKPYKKKVKGYKERPRKSLECNDDNCNVCYNLFPDMNKKYRHCYSCITIRRVAELPFKYAYVKRKPLEWNFIYLSRYAERMQTKYINWLNKRSKRIT